MHLMDDYYQFLLLLFNRDTNKTRITFIYQSDPKVYIPGYLLHMTNCKRGFEMAELLKKATEIKEPEQPK